MCLFLSMKKTSKNNSVQLTIVKVFLNISGNNKQELKTQTHQYWNTLPLNSITHAALLIRFMRIIYGNQLEFLKEGK